MCDQCKDPLDWGETWNGTKDGPLELHIPGIDEVWYFCSWSCLEDHVEEHKQ